MSVFQIVWTTNSPKNEVPTFNNFNCPLDESKITQLDAYKVDGYSDAQPIDYQN